MYNAGDIFSLHKIVQNNKEPIVILQWVDYKIYYKYLRQEIGLTCWDMNLFAKLILKDKYRDPLCKEIIENGLIKILCQAL